jgi:hypothetical protein
MTPSTRSIKKLTNEGWLVWNVESRVPRTNITKDLFGFLDLVALKGGETLGIQVTSASNVSARIKKITNHPNVGIVRDAGWGIEVHGWRKKKEEWICRVVDLS